MAAVDARLRGMERNNSADRYDQVRAASREIDDSPAVTAATAPTSPYRCSETSKLQAALSASNASISLADLFGREVRWRPSTPSFADVTLDVPYTRATLCP